MTHEGRDGDVLKQSPDAVSNRLGEGGVVVNLRTNRIFELNATGMRAWELIGQGRRRADVERQLEAEFESDRAQLRADLDALVAALAREGLVHVDLHP